MQSRFDELRSQIRDKEADARVVPLAMSRAGSSLFNPNQPEEWKFSFDKRVLYGNTSDQTTENRFQASSKLNTELHGQLLKHFLEAQFPAVTFDIEVKPKYKTFLGIPLKIPFIDYGWEKAPNKIRGAESSHLASLPTNVTIKARGALDSIDSDKLWAALNQAACLHSQNEYIRNNDNMRNIQLIASDLSARASLNPFKRVANFLSGLVSRKFAKAFIPESVREVARVNPYGYPVANRVLDYPVVNWGVAAHATNVGVGAAAIAVVLGAAYIGCKDAVKHASSANSSNSAGIGFLMGANGNSNPGFTQTMVATAVAHNAKPGSFANGYAHGVLYQGDIQMVSAIPNDILKTSSSGGGNAPVATRDVIKPKKV